MMWEIVGLASLLGHWKTMPDAPPSEYSPHSGHQHRHHPFTIREVARMRVALKSMSPASYFAIFPEEAANVKRGAAELDDGTSD